MKKIFILTIYISMIYVGHSQDVIFTRTSNDSILVKVLEVNVDNLKYKKYSNLKGPVYSIEKSKIEKVVYENGDIEKYTGVYPDTKSIVRQTSEDLLPGSRIFVTYKLWEGKRNVSGHDAKEMLKRALSGKTSCQIVNSLEEADFEIHLFVKKSGMGDRSASVVINHLLTGKEVLKTKKYTGSSSVWKGYSGSRAAIDKVVKKGIIKKYPEIKI